MSQEDPLTYEEMVRLINRGEFAQNVLASRVGDLSRENAALLAIIDELQTQLAQVTSAMSELKASDDLMSQLASDHHGEQQLHAIPHDEPVPSG